MIVDGRGGHFGPGRIAATVLVAVGLGRAEDRPNPGPGPDPDLPAVTKEHLRAKVPNFFFYDYPFNP